MLTELDLKFIEVAAREIALQRNGGLEAEQICYWCGRDISIRDGAQCSVYADQSYAKRCAPRSVVPTEAESVIAASLHGRLLERNGCKTVDEVVRAASNGTAAMLDCRLCGCSGHATRCQNDGCVEPPAFGQFDTAAFFRAVAIEAMGGAKVTTFSMPERVTGRPHETPLCLQCPRPFSVPTINQEAQS